jgi:hypothetical protein
VLAAIGTTVATSNKITIAMPATTIIPFDPYIQLRVFDDD